MFKFVVFRCGCPPVGCLVINPHGCKHLLDMFEMKQEAKEKLIAQDSFAGNNQRERESDIVVQCKSIDSLVTSQAGGLNVQEAHTLQLLLIFILVFASLIRINI